MENQIKIISEPSDSQPYIVLYKPSGIPSAPLKKDDKNNALYHAAQIYPEILNVNGKKEIEHGLVHRIDTVTDGILVIATTQSGYDWLINLQKENKITKNYKAQCNYIPEIKKLMDGFPESPVTSKPAENQSFTITSFFRPFGTGHKEVRPVTEKSGEAALKKIGKKILYSTAVQITSVKDDLYTVDCEIKNGFRHQVRCHLAWCGLPIVGDFQYNPCCKPEIQKNCKQTDTENIRFTAYKIAIDGKIFEI